jgi:hypothetical protein
MNRKIMAMMVVIAGVNLSLSFSFMGLQDQINENAELQDGLISLPFVQVGRNFLDGLNKTTSKILSIQLK